MGDLGVSINGGPVFGGYMRKHGCVLECIGVSMNWGPILGAFIIGGLLLGGLYSEPWLCNTVHGRFHKVEGV